MALAEISLQLFKEIDVQLQAQGALGRRKILSLGYPDLLVSRQEIAEILGKEVSEAAELHPDKESILRWHGMQDILDEVPEAKNLFFSHGGLRDLYL